MLALAYQRCRRSSGQTKVADNLAGPSNASKTGSSNLTWPNWREGKDTIPLEGRAHTDYTHRDPHDQSTLTLLTGQMRSPRKFGQRQEPLDSGWGDGPELLLGPLARGAPCAWPHDSGSMKLTLSQRQEKFKS